MSATYELTRALHRHVCGTDWDEWNQPCSWAGEDWDPDNGPAACAYVGKIGVEDAVFAWVATLVDGIARYRYETFDSHFSMPGGLSWEDYKADDPDGAQGLYLAEARAALAAALTERAS